MAALDWNQWPLCVGMRTQPAAAPHWPSSSGRSTGSGRGETNAQAVPLVGVAVGRRGRCGHETPQSLSRQRHSAVIGFSYGAVPATTSSSQFPGAPSRKSLNSVLLAISKPLVKASRRLSADISFFAGWTIFDRTS